MKVIELDKENREIKQEVEALQSREKQNFQTDRRTDGTGQNVKRQKRLRNRLLHLVQELMSFLQEKKK